MCIDVLPYALPFIPLLARFIIIIRFWGYMRETLDEKTIDRANHRSLIIALAGFSFAGLLGLVALPGSLLDRALPIWYILLSFLSYLAALNLQGYKAFCWHDQIGDALFEMAAIGLIASVITFVLKSELPLAFRTLATALGVIVWALDFIIRIRFTVQYFLAKEGQNDITK